jgi:ATP-independent RNA helicase DbpA
LTELKRAGAPPLPPMATLMILGGRKEKIRAGDILGALTAAGGVNGKQVGKIDINDHAAYVAVERSVAQAALERLRNAGIKGKSVKVHRL